MSLVQGQRVSSLTLHSGGKDSGTGRHRGKGPSDEKEVEDLFGERWFKNRDPDKDPIEYNSIGGLSQKRVILRGVGNSSPNLSLR